MQATRQRILEILKDRNTATVEELAHDLGLTPVTIRHHLDILRSEGLVQAPQVKRRDTPGRPQHVYGLTEAADAYFPKNYAGFTDMMLHEMRDQVEPEHGGQSTSPRNERNRPAADGAGRQVLEQPGL